MDITHNKILWRDDLSSEEWDKSLAVLGGHPLQSALWGAARKITDGIEELRLAAFVDGEPVLMCRCELRSIRFLGKVAWLPRGPVAANHPFLPEIHRLFLEKLRHLGFCVCIHDPYSGPSMPDNAGISFSKQSQTMVLDLRPGRDAVFSKMHKKMRKNIRIAERFNACVEQTKDPADVADFYRICSQTSERKMFDFYGSEALMSELLTLTNADSSYRARLFVIRVDGKVGAGYLVIENGSSMHEIWTGSDRAFSDQHLGEATLWGFLSWGIEAGLKTHDQEGIDPKGNPGCYFFKKCLGGVEVTLPGKRAFPLNLLGSGAVLAGRLFGKV